MSNIQPYIILNDIDSRTLSGLLISSLPPISKPQVRTQVETVDGRDGDLVTPLGFSAYDKVITIGLTYGYDIDDVIEYFNSEGVVVFSNEPDKFYRYAIYEQIDFDKLIRFKKAEVTLHCQPFKFSTTEDPKLFNVVSGQSITVKNNGNIYSRPDITVIGSGEVDLSLNGSQILSLELADNQAVIIDSENMNAYGAQSAIREVVANIEPKQAGSGDPSPDNIREISGFTEANIVNTQIEEIRELFTIDPSFRGRVNFNQLSNENFSHGGKVNAITSYDLTTGVMEVDPIDYSARGGVYQVRVYQKDHIYLSIGDIRPDNRGRFTFGIEGAGQTAQIIEGGIYTRIYNLAKATSTPQSLIAYYDPRSSQGIIWSSGAYKIKNVNVFDLTQLFGETIADYIYNLEQSQAGAGVEFFKAIYPQEYYPYNAGQDKIVGDITPVTVDLGQTVYGGSLNVTTGELTINTLYKMYNGSENWQVTGAMSYKTRIALAEVLDNVVYPTSTGEALDCICNMFVKRSANDTYNLVNGISYTPNSGLRIYSSAYDTTDINLWKSFLANNPLQVVYKLVTPTTVQLTPTQVNNLLGLNQLYTDTNGDITVKHKSNGVIVTNTGAIVSFTVAVDDMEKGALLNRLVTGDYDKIRLKKGDNTIVLTGNAQQFVIDKYSRWI
jgi:predicted phage tail component-like protein